MSQIITDPTDPSLVVPFRGGFALIGFDGKENRLEGDELTVQIQGGSQADVLSAGLGKSVEIYGFSGDDSIVGGEDDNDLYGNAGNDTMYGLGGDDLVFGGQGEDVIYGGDGNDFVNGDAGNDTVSGGEGDDIVAGGVGDDVLTGDGGDDVVYGEQGNDELYGDDGNDILYGGQGNDILDGGSGEDLISGDRGNDALVGGEGSDTFFFRHLGSANADTVTDFNSGEDVIGLQTSEFSALGASVDASEFVVVGTFDANNPGTARLVYESSTGRLFYIDNGSAQEVAQFLGNPNITSSDFELF